VLVTALASLFAVLSSTASAATFTNSGSTAFTATGVGGTLGITNGAGGVSNLTCSGTDATGNLASGVFTSVTGNVSFAPCTLVGLHTKATCSYSLIPLTFTSFLPPEIDGSASVNCSVALATNPFTVLCKVLGSVVSAFKNPSGTAKGIWRFFSSLLSVSNSSDSSCSAAGVPTGTTRTGDLTGQTINVTNGTPTTLGPVFSSP
jgi:hypothetical protein